MELYARQELMGLLPIPNVALVVGAGGIGYYVGQGLALTGVPCLFISDSDAFEESNLARIPVPRSAIAKRKVEVLVDHINAIRPMCYVQGIENVTEESLRKLPKLDLIVDCTDRGDVQYMTYCFARERKTRYIHGGYNGTHITVESVSSSWTIGKLGRNAYAVVPSASFPCMIIAGLILDKALKHPDLEVSCDISQLSIRDYMLDEKEKINDKPTASTHATKSRSQRQGKRTVVN